MKNSLKEFKGRFEQSGDRINKPENRTIVIIESEEQKEKIEEKGHCALPSPPWHHHLLGKAHKPGDYGKRKNEILLSTTEKAKT